MTVTASPADVPGVYGQGVGKGTQVLNAVAAQQAVVNAAVGPFVVPAAAQLNLLQIEAVDYFMGSYWVSADSILATFGASLTPQLCGRHYAYVTKQLAAIAARLAQINQTNPAQYSQVITQGNEAPQYSAYMPPFPLTPPDTFWYALQTTLVDYLMGKGIVTAASILSTMTSVQTYPFTYNTNGQYFSDSTEGDSGADL
jgi:hypothetical protein